MSYTTDGKCIMYGVFNSDGYECSSLEGIFHTEEEALQVAEKISAAEKEFAERHLRFPWSGNVGVKALLVGEYQMPYTPEMMAGPPQQENVET